MFFKKIPFLLLFLSIAVLTKAQQQLDSVLTLQQCVDLAIKNNLTVKTSGTTMERDRIALQQARENLLPTLNGNVSQSLSFGRSQDPTNYNYVNQKINYGQYGLSSNVLLSNGFSYINAIKQNALAYQAGKMDFQQVKDLTTLNIISFYLQVLNSEDQLTQANSQFNASKVNLERETVLNTAGTVAPADYYNIKGSHANDASNVVNAKNNLVTAKLNLLEAMNVPYNKDIKLVRLLPADQTPKSYDQTSDQIYSTALGSLAQVKAADFRVKAAEKEVLARKGRLYPTLSLGGSINTNYSSTGTTSFSSQFRNNYSYGPGLNLQIPILNYFQNRNNVKLAKLDLIDAQNTSNNIQVQLKQQIEQAYANMMASNDRFTAVTDQVAAYQEAFNATGVKFNAGVVTADIFVIAKNNLDVANTNLINARYDYLIRVKILDYYRGQLTF
ncbi:TolC family protein [Mucilaginibacter sp. OK098]|uniref:TolC family protein n=1 Tax=Mucilaginibacter sp. OK098 TaxID=1855297 RepID=UPI0009126787|nr:TolC family protein [Mucilaginibacter sp. OK098]SHM07334.1 outer membrane protein [Mucilaginibacter sp. OK098]